MRLHCAVVIAAVVLLASSTPSVATAADAAQRELSTSSTRVLARSLLSEPNEDANKRSLRAYRAEDEDESADTFKDSDDDEDEEEEERGFWGLKIKAWLMKGKNPKQIYKKLGLEGLGQEAWKHPNYKHYIKFAKKWNENQ